MWRRRIKLLTNYCKCICMYVCGDRRLKRIGAYPWKDSSTVVSQPVSEGISSETSSQTGSVSSGLSSRADDSGLKNESSSSRTPEASSEVDSENSQSSSEPVSSGTNSTSLSASAGMPSAEISSSTEAKQAATTVDVSYKTHVQTFGWQDWAANGASAGTTGLAKRLEAIQIKTSAPASHRAAFVIKLMSRPMAGWIGSATELLVVLPGSQAFRSHSD